LTCASTDVAITAIEATIVVTRSKWRTNTLQGCSL
jgi:hypothetical protein